MVEIDLDALALQVDGDRSNASPDDLLASKFLINVWIFRVQNYLAVVITALTTLLLIVSSYHLMKSRNKVRCGILMINAVLLAFFCTIVLTKLWTIALYLIILACNYLTLVSPLLVVNAFP